MGAMRIEPSIIAFPNTYISAVSRFTMTFFNDSDSIVHVKFYKNSSRKEDLDTIENIDDGDPEQRKELGDILLYKSSIFQIECDNNEIRPHKSINMIISFVPEIAQTYTDTIYADVGEEFDRIPIPVRGTGLPPNAYFDIDSINIGHVSLDSIFEYKVSLQNTGQVGVDFCLENKQMTNALFEVTPSSGHIDIGCSIDIKIKFTAYAVGSFSEDFRFLVRGATHDHPTVSLYGRILGPTYVVNVKTLLFGTCSYGFLYTQTFDVENKSDIPFDYNFTLSHDGSFARREFSITPISGTIGKYGKQTVKIEFIPISLQEYHLQLYMNIPKFGDKLYTIPIIANCISPEITLEKSRISLDSVFIGYSYKAAVKLVNDTDYPGKYEYLDSIEANNLQAKVDIPKPNGIILPHTTQDVFFTVTPHQLGPLNLSHSIKISGCDGPPLTYSVVGTCTGPTINLSTQLIQYGSIPVLKPTTKDVIITNTSLIDSSFTAAIQSDYDVFELSHRQGSIPPNGSLTLSVTARLDDPSRFNAKIILTFENLNPISIDIRAQGVGTPVTADIPMQSIDFGYVFCERTYTKTFNLINKGRKPQDIRFTIIRPKTEDQGQNLTLKIIPESFVIPPHDQTECTIQLSCLKPLTFNMQLQAHTTLNKQRVELYSPALKGTFIRPILQFSNSNIEFKHIHDVEQEERMLSMTHGTVPSTALLKDETADLVITNSSKLPLSVVADCPSPFEMEETEFKLEPNESKTINVVFTTDFKTDFCTEVIQRKITFSFVGLPQKFYVNLKGSLVFPNLTFSSNGPIDFGSMLMNTEQTKDIIVKAANELPVDYEWELLPVNGNADISKIFDIYPMRAHIEPGTSEIAHVSFFAQNESSSSTIFEGTAVCHVKGGPEYVIKLKGGSANIKYQIEPNVIDFGKKSYLEPLNSTISLTNSSDVQITYSVKTSKTCKFSSLVISPIEGFVNPGASVTLNINIVTGLPITYSESFFIQIGHFDDFRIDLDVECYIPQLSLSLPRCVDDPVVTALKDEHKEINPENFSLEENVLITDMIRTRGATSRRRKLKNDNNDSFEGFALAKYLLDFGNVVFGKKETKTFKIKSTAPFPVSFEIFTNILSGTGFSIDTTSFENIPPDAEIELEMTFNTAKRTTDIIGEVQLDIPIVMNDDYAFFICLKANLMMPGLQFSRMHFDFGNVIVGQTLVMTLQLQNMNNVPVEYHFGEAEFLNVLHRSMAQGAPPPFTASPSNGILPPSSFINVEIVFSPKSERSFSMQFPITIKHNTSQSYVSLRGNGIQLKVVFDPPELIMPPILPFSEPRSMDVKLINPTAYPIEVMAQQFDLQLLLDTLDRDDKSVLDEASVKSDEIGFVSASNAASKFAICIIVNGPPGSGRTTVARAISKSINDVPIISLKEIWAPILEKEGAEDADFVDALQRVIQSPECGEGFVVDGLDALPEPADLDHFLSQCLKQKNVMDEIEKNPFAVFPHTNPTAAERALNYILASVEGHYVFQVALKATEEEMNRRAEEAAELEKKSRRLEQQKERERLFNMTEDQYENLTPEEKAEVDKKRHAIRKRLIRDAATAEEGETERSSRHHHRSKDGKKHHSSKDKNKDKKDDKKEKKSDKREKKEEKKEEKKAEEQTSTPKRKRGALPTDPIGLSILTFSFTLGTIAQKLRECPENCNYTVVDPVSLLDDSAAPTTRVEEIEQPQPEEGQNEEDDKVVACTSSIILQPLIEASVSITALETNVNFTHNVNSLIIDVKNPPNMINSVATRFVPHPMVLKNKAFTRLIPPARLVLPDPKTFRKPTLAQMPQHFFIQIDEEQIPDIKSIIERPNTTAKPNGRKSNASNKRKKQAESARSDIDFSKRTPRWLIEANSDVTLTLIFDGQLIGNYKDTIIFSLTNGKADLFKLPVSCIVGYPDIERDIKSIFPKRAAKFDSKVESSWVAELQEFCFGSILVTKDKPTKGHTQYKSALQLTNNSHFPAEITANIADNSKSVFALEHSQVTIQPGETNHFVFGIHPQNPDIYKARIELFIKDHPDPLYFNISGDACVPQLEFGGNAFDFEKMLLNQTKTLRIDIKNVGKLQAYWRLKNFQALGENFTFNQTEGILNPRQGFGLTCMFTSPKPFSTKKQITIEVLDSEKARTFSSSNISVAAESFDVNIDFQFPKGMDSLNFGTMKVGQPKTLSCVLVNKGKYPLNYKVAFAQQNVSSVFQITPMDGTVAPNNKNAVINFTFMSNRVVSFNNAKCVVLTVVDALTKTTTATLPVSFSAVTMFSSYKIEPMKSLDFGAARVSNAITRKIELTNTGVFPFDYEIAAKPDENERLLVAGKKGAKAQKPTPQRGKQKKGSDKAVNVGNFTMTPSSATINPGQTIPIEIDFLSQSPGRSQSTALFHITDTNPNHTKDGIPFNLIAEAFIPGINTTSFDKIFPGLNLCLQFDRKKLTKNAYIEDEQVLFFTPLILQQKSTVTVNLINPFPIPCSVDITIKPKTKMTSNFPFDVSEKAVTIEGNQTVPITLTFNPVTCDKFQAFFEAMIRGSNSGDNRCLKFGVEGTGTLPVVTAVGLEKPAKSSIYQVNLGKTLTGFIKEKMIVLKNEGLIPARISISAKATPDFELADIETTNELSIEPQRTLALKVVFMPQKVHKSQFDIAIGVLDNPKANIGFAITGEGFSEDIIFEGLRGEDELMMRDNVVGRQQSSTFIMRNVSQNDCKFTWQQHPDFTFSPRVGHLRLGASKEITVTFFSDKPVKHNGVKAICQWTKTMMANVCAPDWDDTMKVIKYVTRRSLLPPEPVKPVTPEENTRPTSKLKKNASKKSQPIPEPKPEPEIPQEDLDELVRVTEVKPEPPNTPIQGKYKDLTVKIFAVSDNIKYTIDTSEIAFAPTMMFQTRVSNVKISNPTQIRFEYMWVITKFKALRSDYAATRPPPFLIEPSSGFIESGQSTTFKIKFAPEEVDDFTATAVCEIPFLAHMEPPSISLSGISRRPLCHFNVEMSDYISSGRRHPDYSYELPPETKVVEVFAKGPGSRVCKKIEIINPTASPYEVQWRRLPGPDPSVSEAIVCDTPDSLISSGKRYLASFTYSPTSHKTVESLWSFTVPEHHVTINMLVVGRIMPQ